NFVLHAIGEEFVRLFFAQIFERKHGNTFCRGWRLGDGVNLWPGKTFVTEYSHEKEQDGDNNEVELSRCVDSPRRSNGSIFRALAAFRRQIEQPGKSKRNWKPKGNKDHNRAHDPARNVKNRENLRDSLSQRPPSEGVRNCNSVNVASLQLA